MTRKIKDAQGKDEGRAFDFLAELEIQPSYLRHAFLNWDPGRGEAKKILGRLSDDRLLRTASGSLVGATGFEAIKGGEPRRPVRRNRRALGDSWQRCVDFVRVSRKKKPHLLSQKKNPHFL